jgi:4-amino-4-deoxy-L-arabinose transferase-like glycosyltransferase
VRIYHQIKKVFAKVIATFIVVAVFSITGSVAINAKLMKLDSPFIAFALFVGIAIGVSIYLVEPL